MLTILMGRAKSGKTEWMLRRIAALGDHSRQVLLVPEHATYAGGDGPLPHLRRHRQPPRGGPELPAAGDPGALRHRGACQMSRWTQGGKLLTLQKALGEVAPELKLYRRPSRKAAFLTGMLDLFDEFQSFAVSAGGC